MIIMIIITIIIMIIIIMTIINDKSSKETKILDFFTRPFMNNCSYFQALFEHWQITNSIKIMPLKRLLSCIMY